MKMDNVNAFMWKVKNEQKLMAKNMRYKMFIVAFL